MNRLRELCASFGMGELYFALWWRFGRTYEPKTAWSEEQKAFFVHIPKTAGTSLRSALGITHQGYTHVPVRVLEQLYPEELESYYVFSVVRNPWDRMVSVFEHATQKGGWPKQQAWADRTIGTLDFAEFVRRLGNEPAYRRAVMGYDFFFPQRYFLEKRDGTVRCDRIIPFEQLSDAAALLREHFPQMEELGHERRNASRKRYQDYYDDETRAIVGELYRQDIALCDYRFD